MAAKLINTIGRPNTNTSAADKIAALQLMETLTLDELKEQEDAIKRVARDDPNAEVKKQAFVTLGKLGAKEAEKAKVDDAEKAKEDTAKEDAKAKYDKAIADSKAAIAAGVAKADEKLAEQLLESKLGLENSAREVKYPHPPPAHPPPTPRLLRRRLTRRSPLTAPNCSLPDCARMSCSATESGGGE